MQKRKISPFSLSLSVGLHLVLGLYLSQYSFSPTREREDIKEVRAAIVYLEDQVDSLPINPQEELGSEDEETIEDVLEGIQESYDEIREDLNEDFEEPRDVLKDMNKSLEEISKSIKDLSKTFEMMNVYLDKRDLREHYISSTSEDERNEVSYSEYFRRYANSHIFFNDKESEIEDLLKANSDLREVVKLEVIFCEDGRLEFESIELVDGFEDEENRVIEHYRSLFAEMPRDFVPPSEAGLEAPYRYSYVVVNRNNKK